MKLTSTLAVVSTPYLCQLSCQRQILVCSLDFASLLQGLASQIDNYERCDASEWSKRQGDCWKRLGQDWDLRSEDEFCGSFLLRSIWTFLPLQQLLCQIYLCLVVGRRFALCPLMKRIIHDLYVKIFKDDLQTFGLLSWLFFLLII